MFPDMVRNKIYIINGPNLNRLGRRDRNIYGGMTMEECLAGLRNAFPDVEIACSQSNGEGAIIDMLQQAGDDESAVGVVINPGAYAHYSYAIADAIADLRSEGIPAVEVHISNIHGREEYRRRSVTAPVCTGCIAGLGMEGYALAVRYLLQK